MKAFIIHTPHQKSIEYAQQALDSFKDYSGWEPELFEGLTPETLGEFEHTNKIDTKKNSRAECYLRDSPDRYVIKKCCSLNHYRLFKRCVALNTPIAVIEHDAHCIGDWVNLSFDDVLVMNIESAIEQKPFSHIRRNITSPVEGLHDVNIAGLNYRHDPALKNAHIMPGTAAYAITPAGAAKMISVYETAGWEQSDFIINTAHVRIQTIMPELFTFKLPNLEMSHGRNM